MATQDATPATTPPAEVVGNAFVEQYYHILHQSPGMVHRFYQDSSLLSRPDANGLMTTVTTMQAINDKIISLKYEDYTAEIKTADAQASHEKGVIVLVTGCLTGKDNARRKFSQTFFLAPQDKGYYVLNDVFRYVDEGEPLPVNGNDAPPVAPVAPEPEPSHAQEQPAVEPADVFAEEDLNDNAEVCDPSDNEGSVIEEETLEPAMHSVVDSTPAAEEDAPKKSYAMIVKVTQGNVAGNVVSRSVRAPSTAAKVVPANTTQQPATSAKPINPVAAAPSIESVPESSNVQEEVEGHSIYIRNLPFNATVEQLEDEFKRFGPIKPNGIQVRSAKGFCFGFVEFESLNSMQSALASSPITIGDRDAFIEEKRTTTRVTGSGRGRYSGRGGFRSDSFRGRGNFGGGRGYGRNEFREFSGRPRGSAGRGGESYQRASQNGGGRGGRGGGNRNPAS